jgi:hypothetical protein
MFYKINPVLGKMSFDLAADGFRVRDRLWIDLRGDFQASISGRSGFDEFQNTTFRLGAATFDATRPMTVKAGDTLLVARNHDRPLVDNSDPDGDYGVAVKLVAFTSGDDFFRFGRRPEMPDVKGSIYHAQAGDDVLVMPDDPIPGLNLGRTFRTGAGDDEVRAGDLGFRVNFGTGTDTLVLENATIGWGNRENRDNDGVLLVRSGSERYRVDKAEILEDGGDGVPLVKWYFRVARERDGDCAITFFENGTRVARTEGAYDETKAIPAGRYEAFLFRPDGRGSEQIELLDAGGFSDVSIRTGAGRNPRKDFVVDEDFMDTVFDSIRDAYEAAGSPIPWRKGEATPVVPITVQLSGRTAGAAERAADLAVDRHDAPAMDAVADDFLL